MSIIIYQEQYDLEEVLDNFQALYFGSQMKYLASDLLNNGLTSADIKQAIQRAMTIAETSGMEIRKHFQPVFTQCSTGIVRDCKLSRLGYAMVLLNARPELPIVGEWQRRVLERFFER